MIAPDDDRCADLAARDEVINALAESCALAVAQPADARGQALVWHALSREAYPPGEDPILGKERDDGLAVTRHRGAGSAHVLLRIGAAEGPGVGHPGRDVPIERVVGARLIR